MRRIIIDTDCGSDDAVAIIMALKSDEVKVEAITTIGGNVPLKLATKNALMSVEICNLKEIPPLYAGVQKPLFKELVTAVNVHGKDGMGDIDIIHPTILPEKEHAVDAILRLVRENPNEIEIVTIGPATNIALAIMKEPTVMRQVKHIYSMGTTGFGRGNCTSVSEFNVYVDAEAYHIMLNSGIPVTIIGFDVCVGEAALIKDEIDILLNSGVKTAEFAMQCNCKLVEYNLEAQGKYFLDLPDAVAMSALIWPDIVKEKKICYAHVCLNDPETYGQVILNDGSKLAIQEGFLGKEPNVEVCVKIDSQTMKSQMMELLMREEYL